MTPTHPRTISEMEHPPHGERPATKHYESELERLQIELLKAQRHVQERG